MRPILLNIPAKAVVRRLLAAAAAARDLIRRRRDKTGALDAALSPLVGARPCS